MARCEVCAASIVPHDAISRGLEFVGADVEAPAECGRNKFGEYGRLRGIHEVPQKNALVFSPQQFLQLTDSSIAHRLQYPPGFLLTSEKQKMTLPFSNNINSLNTAINVWSNCTIADDRSQILTWLSPLEPRLQHQDIQYRRVDNIGEWLLQTDEFRNWYAGNEGGGCDNAVLFCHGNPGVGKTYIR